MIISDQRNKAIFWNSLLGFSCFFYHFKVALLSSWALIETWMRLGQASWYVKYIFSVKETIFLCFPCCSAVTTHKLPGYKQANWNCPWETPQKQWPYFSLQLLNWRDPLVSGSEKLGQKPEPPECRRICETYTVQAHVTPNSKSPYLHYNKNFRTKSRTN